MNNFDDIFEITEEIKQKDQWGKSNDGLALPPDGIIDCPIGLPSLTTDEMLTKISTIHPSRSDNWNHLDDKELQEIFRYFYVLGYRSVKDKKAEHYKNCPSYNTEYYRHKSDLIRIKLISNDKRRKTLYYTISMPNIKDIETLKFRENKKLHEILEKVYTQDYIPLTQANRPYQFVPTFLHNGKKINAKKADSKCYIESLEHIVLEFDDIDIDKQLKLMDLLKPCLAMAVYSGNKSIHFYLKINKTNTHNIDRDTKFFHVSDEGETKYQSAKNHLIEYLAQNGYQNPCLSINDYSHFFRIPSYPRPNGKTTSLLYVNTDIVSVEDWLCSAIFPRERKEEEEAGMTICVPPLPLRIIKNDQESSKTTKNRKNTSIDNFLNQLTIFDAFRVNGIPKRGDRIQCMKAVKIYSKIHNLEETVTNQLWEDIINKSNGRYGCTREAAVEDFKRYMAKTRKDKLYLPDMSQIEWDDKRISTYLLENLENISEVDLNRTIKGLRMIFCGDESRGFIGAQSLIQQSIDGNFNISTKKLRKVTGKSMHYKDILNRLIKLNIIERKTTEHWDNGKWNCAGYYVNLHLLVYILYRDRQEELMWDCVEQNKNLNYDVQVA